MYYDHHEKNGKNSKALYYIPALMRFYGPSGNLRRKLKRVLETVEQREDRDYILDRVDYYNRLSVAPDLYLPSSIIGDLSLKKERSVYVLDSHQYLRWFPRDLRWDYLFGDITHIPEVPSIVKSRPVAGDNANSILLNLDKVRHFTFLDDRIPFREKEGRAVFRGKISPGKPNRALFMEKFCGHPLCDAAIVGRVEQYPPEWSSPPSLSLWEHLKYRYVMALEGHDVASNLKWVMSSNSVAVSPRPVYETWFMEGRLIPNVHYIEVQADFSDLEEKIEHYNTHPEEAEAIAYNANEYVRQFLHPEREDLISLMVLDKYFRMTGQM